jgi:hypothetical protein
MSYDSPDIALSKIQRAIHRSPIAPQCRCDYCAQSVDSNGPVLYDVIRVVDLPYLQQILRLPDVWLLDALRCDDCAIETIDPATDGYDEALVRVDLVTANETVRIDTGSIEFVDYSPTSDGHYPPMIAPSQITQDYDVGVGRWIRIAGFLDAEPQHPETIAHFTTICERSSDVPLGLP